MGASPKTKLIEVPRNPEALAPGDLTDRELADELGEKLRQVKVFKPTADRCDLLKKEMQLRGEQVAAESSVVLDGLTWRTTASPKGMVTSIPPPSTIHRMFRAAKKDFYAAVQVTLKAVKENLGDEALERMSTKARTGYRTIDAVLLNKAPAA